MANTGFNQLRFSGPLEGSEGEARRFAVHAKPLLESAKPCQNLAELTGDLTRVYGFSPRAPWADGRNLGMETFLKHMREDLAAGHRIGLLYGNEAHGLDNEALANCDYRVCLPAASEYVSMNLAQAVMVTLWELMRDMGGEDQPVAEVEMATITEKGRLAERCLEFAAAMDFTGSQSPQGIEQEFRGLFHRHDWTQREMQLLMGLFAKGRTRYQALVKKLDE
jgi:tRNA/rRNA methyltransferase